ncbi:MAG: hypoxanthine phosphoribosyltransferase [Oscillospiraceae bacterium]|nr:hypoxanthine phosphoribosyltransferase [Oscillospiraceae bacterium]
MHEDVLKVLLSEQEIADKVAEMGKQISEDYKVGNLMLVTVLKGAVVFLADIMRKIDIHAEIDFMVVSSYGAGVKSSGVVKIIKDLDVALEGKDILIIEDILDSGLTLNYIKELLQSRNPASIKIAALLDKPSRRKVDLQADYVGFVVPDEFVIGYGLDFDEKYRNLPYIGVLKPEVYSN